MIFKFILLGIFIVATIIGFLLIKNVPSLLHTPLMSGMNALSGITILGSLTTTAIAISSDSKIFGYIFGSIAIVLAMVNIVGGFVITDKMLKMFKKKER